MNTEIATKNYNQSIEYIKNDLKEMAQNFVKIGYHLIDVEENEYYKVGGYDSVAEFAEDIFGMEKSATSRYIKICKTFSEGGNSMRLDDKYKGFSYSQLAEMVTVDEEDRAMIDPEMTIRDIRELKKQLKTDKLPLLHMESIDGIMVDVLNEEKTYNGLRAGYFVTGCRIFFANHADQISTLDTRLKNAVGYGAFLQIMGEWIHETILDGEDYIYEYTGTIVSAHMDKEGLIVRYNEKNCTMPIEDVWETYRYLKSSGQIEGNEKEDEEEAKGQQDDHEEIPENIGCDVAKNILEGIGKEEVIRLYVSSIDEEQKERIRECFDNETDFLGRVRCVKQNIVLGEFEVCRNGRRITIELARKDESHLKIFVPDEEDGAHITFSFSDLTLELVKNIYERQEDAEFDDLEEEREDTEEIEDTEGVMYAINQPEKEPDAEEIIEDLNDMAEYLEEEDLRLLYQIVIRCRQRVKERGDHK